MTSKRSALCSPFLRATAQLGALLATLLAVLMLLNLSANASITYSIKDGDQQLVLSTNATDLSKVLDEAGVEHSELDLLDKTVTDEVINLNLIRRQYVTVICDGVTTSMLAETQGTARDVLEHLNIKLGEFDQLNVDLDTVLNNEVTELVVNRGSVSYREESIPIPYGQVRAASLELPIGEEAITTEGKDGSEIRRYQVITMEDGSVTEELISTDRLPAVDEVISYGTKTSYSAPTSGLSTSSEYITNIDYEEMTFTTSRGNVYRFSKTLTLNATAYTSGPNGQTSTGRRAQVGVVAIDPKYISYGTQMFIMSESGNFVYGKCVAGDCGGAIDNNDVDLYMTSESLCESWGRRNVTAFIITETLTQN